MEGIMVDKLSIKDKLSQKNEIKKSITKIERKIKNLEENDTRLASVEESYKRPPYTKHNVVVQAQTKRTRDLISRYKSVLQERLNDLLEVDIEIEEFINTLPTARLQSIFEYKYIDGYTWQKIAFIIGGTEESLKQECSRFLKEN